MPPAAQVQGRGLQRPHPLKGDLTRRVQRKYQVFNTKCLAIISRRTVQEELRLPSFNIVGGMHWRLMVFVGKILWGEKGKTMLDMLHWNFEKKTVGRRVLLVAEGPANNIPGSGAGG